MSNFNFKKFFIGAVLVAASFIPGLNVGVWGALAINFLRTAGLGLALQSFGKSISSVVDRSQEMSFSRFGTDVPLPVVYGEAKVAAVIADIRADPDDPNKLWVVAAFTHASQDGTDVQELVKVWFDDRLAFVNEDSGYNLLTPFRQGGDSVGSPVSGLVGANYPEGTTVFTSAINPDDPWSIVKAGDTFIITGESGTPVHTVLSRTSQPVTQYDDDNPGQFYEYDIINLTFEPGIAAGGVTSGMGIDFTHTPTRYGVTDFATIAVHGGVTSQTVDSTLNAKFPAEWPSTSKGAGICYAVFSMTWNEEAYTGFPNITALIRGQHVWDPRDSTWKYSDNPALCVRDQLTAPIYGLGCVSADLDEQSFIDMANHCDEVVERWAGGPTGKRFTCNGWVATERNPDENILDLLTSCRGMLIHEGGKYRIHIPRAVTPSALKLTSDNIIGDWNFTTPGIKDSYNIVAIQYIDPDQNFQPQTVDWPAPGASNPYLTADNGYVVRTELHLPFTNNRPMAQQIGMTLVKESRTPIGVRLTCKEEALSYRIGDVAPLTHDTPGWVDKLFWVYGVLLNEDSTVSLSLVEYSAAAYGLDSQAVPPASAGTTLPNPFTAYEPLNVTVLSDSSTLQQTADGTVIPGILVTWDLRENYAPDHTEILARKLGTDPWSFVGSVDSFSLQEIMITGPLVEGETWEVQVRTVNTLGVPSAWIRRVVGVVGKTAAPFDVTGFAGTFADGKINVRWDAAADIDLDEYEIREGGTDWDSAAFFNRYRTTQFAIQPSSVTKRTYIFRIKAIDTSNNYSVSAASVTLSDLKPDASVIVGGDLVVTGRDTNFTVTVDATGSLATEFRLYASKTNGFTPGDTTRRAIVRAFEAAPGLVFTFLPPDSTWFGATIYFKVGLKDELTDVLGDGEQFTTQFTGTTSDLLIGSSRLAEAAVALSKLDAVLAERFSFIDSRNVVLNPGFEQGDTYWGQDLNLTHSVETGAGAFSGNKYLKLIATSVAFGECRNVTDTGASRFVEIPPGAIIKFGCKAYKESGTQAAAMNLNMADKDQVDVSVYPATPPFSGASWASYEATFTPAANQKYFKIYFSTGNSGSLCTFRVDDVWVQLQMPGGDLVDLSIATVKLGDAQVTTTKLGDSSVTTAKIGNTQVSEAKLVDSAVTAAKLAQNAVELSRLAEVLAAKVSFVDARNVTLNPGFEQGDKYWGGDTNVTHSILTGGAGGTSVSDAFTGMSGSALSGRSPWVSVNQDFWGFSSTLVRGLANADNLCRYGGAGLANDQEAQVVIVEVGTDTLGPAIRIATGGAVSAYMFYTDSTQTKLAKIVSGTVTVLASGGSPASVNDVLKVRAVGTTITGYINGIEELNATDSALTSGEPGLYGFGGNNVTGCDTWFAQDFSGSAAFSGNKCMEVIATAVNFGTVYNRTDIGERYIEVPPGAVIRFGCKAKVISGSQSCSMNLNMADKDKGDAGSYPGVSSVFSGSSWTSYTGEYTPAADEKYFRIYLSTGNSGSLVTFHVDDMWVLVSIAGADIIARSITADRIGVDVITANEIAALTITAAEIAASTITGAKIAAGTITATEIATNTLTAAQIAADAITSNELAANAVIAGKIAAGTIVAGDIAALAITGAKIAAGTIDASKINVSSLAAISADVGDISAGKLRNAADTFGILLSGTVPGGWTRWLNMIDSGNDFLRHDKLSLHWDGSATFGGKIDIADPSLVVGGADKYVVLRSGGVAHGITTWAPTDVLGMIGEAENNVGGLLIEGLTENQNGVWIRSYAAQSGAAPGAIILSGSLKSGTDITDMTNDDIVLGVYNNLTQLFTIQADGTIGTVLRWDTGNITATPPGGSSKYFRVKDDTDTSYWVLGKTAS